MYVKNRMQKEVRTITADYKINEALNFMARCELHRLPVVTGPKLIGLITEGRIAEHTPSKATSLSIHEMNYLLSKMTVDEIMIKEVITVSPDTLLEDAAYLMRQKDIGCLPVVDRNNNLQGILTTGDIVDAFIDMIGLNSQGVRLEINVGDDRIGVLAAITEIFSQHNINISRLSIFQEGSEYVIIVLTSTTALGGVEEVLADEGYEIRAKHVYKEE